MGNGVSALIIQAQQEARRRQQQQQQYDASVNAAIPGYSGPQNTATPTAQPTPHIATLQDALNYFHGFPFGGGGQPTPYQFGQIPGMNAQPSPLSSAGIPMTPVGQTPSQYSAPPSSGPYGLLAQQLAGIQQPTNVPNAPDNTPGMLPPKQRGLLQS